MQILLEVLTSRLFLESLITFLLLRFSSKDSQIDEVFDSLKVSFLGGLRQREQQQNHLNNMRF